ncbi:MAG: hypothetical protein ABIR16_05400 [Dokdonella sp.]
MPCPNRFDQGPRPYQQAFVLDIGRAGRLAGAAGQALVQMGEEAFADFDPLAGDCPSKSDAAARRLGFVLRQGIRRAMRQAQPTHHALVSQLQDAFNGGAAGHSGML